MKKIMKRCAAPIAAVVLASQCAYAESYIRLSGYTDSEAVGISVLVLDKDADIHNVKDSDIKYIDEGTISEDGIYDVRLPISLDYNESRIYSNVNGFNLTPSDAERTKTFYVSDSGSDDNLGESTDAPLKTLGAAYGKFAEAEKIVLMSDTNFFMADISYDGVLEIEGLTGNEKLILPENTYFCDDVKIDNVILEKKDSGKTANLFANGNNLTIGSGVRSEDRFSVYGGADNKEYTGDTHLTLLGGKYMRIYGGSKKARLCGNTNVIIGGNVNAGDNIDDESDNSCPCYVYGGCMEGDVTGKTNVTLDGNAVMGYVVGSSSGGYAYTTDTNIFIKGGKAINVYGGSTDGAYLENCNTHITMTGGLVEGIFGASVFNSFKGNTYITLLGGDVSRRVYTGCYNDWSWSWLQRFQVYGTTNLVIGPDVNLNSQKELSSGNALNIGVFAGSRQGLTAFDGEVNTVVFIDDCYEAKKDCMGDVSGWNDIFGSFPHYTAAAGKDGTVVPTQTAGKVDVVPKRGYYAKVGEENFTEANIALEKDAVTKVSFVKDFNINSVETTDIDGGISAKVGLSAKNVTNQISPCVIAAVYDEEGRIIAVSMRNTNPDNESESFDLNCNLEAGKKYIVKAMIWDKNNKPLTSVYNISVK